MNINKLLVSISLTVLCSVGYADSNITRKNIDGIFFSLVDNVTENVQINYGVDVALTNYNVSVSGGTATLHNGHSDKAAPMIKTEGINVGNSGFSYLKIDLNQPLKTGDILTTTGTPDGGYVGSEHTYREVSNIVNHQFVVPDSLNGKSTIYIMRGAENVGGEPAKYCLIKSLTIARPWTLPQKKEWEFSEWYSGDIQQNITVNGLTVGANSEQKVTIDRGEITRIFEGRAFNKRLKLNGTGFQTGRYVSFEVTGPCLIKVYLMNANSEAPASRPLMISFGSFGNNAQTVTYANSGELTIGKYYYEGETTTAYLYSGNSALNFYDIQVLPNYCIVEEEVWFMSPESNNEFIVPDAISITDKSTFSTKVPFTARNISYSRSMSRQWGTLCLPFAVTQSKENNPYDFYTIQSAAGDVITLKRFADGTIPAGTPMVVRRNAEETGIEIVETNVAVISDPLTGASANGLTLNGTFSGTSINSGEGYYIASDKFWRATKTISIPAYRAYFEGALSSESNQLRICLYNAISESTDIEPIASGLDLEHATFYNLCGGKQSSLQPGVNIVRMNDGSCRKIIVK